MPFLDKDLTSAEQDTVGSLLIEFGDMLQGKLVDSLWDKNASDSAKLSQSINFTVEFDGQGWLFELSMEDYAKFIDEGVQGVGGERKSDSLFSGETKGTVFQNVAPQSQFKYKVGNKPSAKHFTNWANRKGISPYAARESVFRKGLKPNHFYSDVVDEKLINGLVKKLESKGAKAIEIEIVEAFKGKVE